MPTPISPETILQIGETYTLAACFLTLGIGVAGGALWYLRRRLTQGEPQTHMIAQSFEEAQGIAAAQPGGVAVEKIVRNQPGRPAKIILRHDN